MGNIIEFNNTEKLSKLEKQLEEVQQRFDKLDRKIKLSCNSGMAIKDNLKAEMFDLLAEEHRIISEIRTVKGLTDNEDEIIFKQYEESIKQNKTRVYAKLKQDMSILPAAIEERRKIVYQQMQLYLTDLKNSVEAGLTIDVIMDAWEMFEYSYDFVVEEDYELCEMMEKKEKIPFEELDRIEKLNLSDLCNETLTLFADKENFLNGESVLKMQYIEKVYAYRSAILNAIYEMNIK